MVEVKRKLGSRLLTIGKREIPLLFSNRALADAERVMGKGIIGVLNGFQGGGNSGIGDVAALLQAGAEAARRYYRLGGKRYTLNDAFALMDQIGFTEVTTTVFEAVAEVISYERGDDDDDAEEDPDAEKN